MRIVRSKQKSQDFFFYLKKADTVWILNVKGIFLCNFFFFFKVVSQLVNYPSLFSSH